MFMSSATSQDPQIGPEFGKGIA